MKLHRLLENSAGRRQNHVAVVDAERNNEITYGDFNALVSSVRSSLTSVGVRPNDRIGIYSPKSIASLTSVFSALQCGAAYVPVDPDAPPARNAYIFSDCGVRAIVVEKSRLAALQSEVGSLKLEVMGALEELQPFGVELVLVKNAASENEASDQSEELAYILYTSGSTGKPKGVVHTHASALSFVDWCSDTFAPREDDRFSSHAPFHFDLSILDIYVPIKHGATLVLFGETLGKQPKMLAEAIARHRITMWYSTPSILRLLSEFGDMGQQDFSSLRVVNFAGEVFPIKHFLALKEQWPHPRYFNLYGPTETNVCTWHELPSVIPRDRTQPFPIGNVCSNDRAIIVNQAGEMVERGEEGELLVAGGSVMSRYWNMPERTEQSFYVDPDGVRWYRTGDVVQQDARGELLFLGRRDRMVKRRGYRVELGEIEATLYRHPSVREAAVVALPDEESGVLITAHLSWAGEGRPSTIKMKQFSAANLPLYMVPDRFIFQSSLPKTSTDKIDYQQLSNGKD